MARLSDVTLLNESHQALTNALLPALQARLAPMGYGPAAIAEGMALRKALDDACTLQLTRFGKKLGGTEKSADAFAAARKGYMRHVELARLVFVGDEARIVALGLRGDRAQNRPDLHDQANSFYTNLLADAEAVAAMAKVDAGEAALQAAHAAFSTATKATAAQRKTAGDAKAATKARRVASQALRTWLSRFFGFARIACADDPQLLEQLGLKAPS